MIVREYDSDFIMIRQHDHALISAKMVKELHHKYFPSDSFKSSVQYAIKMHDIGWSPFDDEPFWNDEKQAPYSFIDFPTSGKTVLYKHGIDEVEKDDVYAALLCSKHYSRFLKNDRTNIAHHFIEAENKRQDRLMNRLKGEGARLEFHYDLVRLFDNFSLYICLNDSWTPKEKEHPFFKNGIPMPKEWQEELGDYFNLQWESDDQISCSPFPFQQPFDITLIQKTVAKDDIQQNGLLKSYIEAKEEKVTLRITERE